MSTAPQLSYANVGSSLDKVATLGLAPGRKPTVIPAAKPVVKPAPPKPVIVQQPIDLSNVGKPVVEEPIEEEKVEQPKIKRTSGYAIVKAVLSGDTIVVLGAAPTGSTVIPEKVITISGITAPKFGRGKAGVDEPFGWEAREFLRKKIIGAQVQFSIQHTSESGRDYGVVKLNGNDLAQEIVRAGYAEVKKPKTDRIPDDKASLFLLQQEAEALGVGKWRLKHLSDEQKHDVIRKIRWDEDNKLLYQRSKGMALPAIIDQVRDGSTFRVEIHGLHGLNHDIITLHLAGVQCPRTPLPKSVRESNAAALQENKPVEEDTSDDIAAATKIDKKAKKEKAKKGEKKEEEAPKKKDEKKKESKKAETPAPAAAPARPPRQPQPADDEGEPFGIEAQQFVEARLLHRDVHVILQGLDKFNNVFGSIQYPKGNIAVKLLELGYGKYVPWSAQITPDAQKLKEAELSAKKNHLRLWQNYVEPADAASIIPEYMGRVIQVHSGDTVTVIDLNDEKHEQKVSLASITAPRLALRGIGKDEPFALEAKEFLRSRLIGHKVKIVNEYTRTPPKDSTDQTNRQYVSIFSQQKANISEQLLSAGLAEVVRHGKNEDRSLHYEEYVSAENRAREQKKGKYGGATGPAPERIIDLSVRGPIAGSDAKESGGRKGSITSGDSKLAVAARQSHARAQNEFKRLSGQKQVSAIVEHVFSGARVKLYLPQHNILLAFALAGVKVPAAKTKDGKSNDEHAALGAQALHFTRSRILQHAVKVDIEALDKGSNFIGNLFTTQKQNLAELLLSEGLAEIFEYSVKNNEYKDALKAAEDSAKHARKGVFKNWTPETVDDSTPQQEHKEFKEGSELIKITVTEIIDAATFFAQIVDDKGLETVQQGLASFAENVPEQDENLKVTPGKLYAGQFTVDDAWYRVRVEGKIKDTDEYRVFFVDYGNHDLLDISRLRELPAELSKIPDSAHLCFLAAIKSPNNEEWRERAIGAFTDLVWERQLLAKVEATQGYGRDRRLHVTLQDESAEQTVNSQLVREGFVKVAKNVPTKLKDLQTALLADQEIAHNAHSNVWESGDISDDDEHEQ